MTTISNHILDIYRSNKIFEAYAQFKFVESDSRSRIALLDMMQMLCRDTITDDEFNRSAGWLDDLDAEIFDHYLDAHVAIYDNQGGYLNPVPFIIQRLFPDSPEIKEMLESAHLSPPVTEVVMGDYLASLPPLNYSDFSTRSVEIEPTRSHTLQVSYWRLDLRSNT